VINLIIALKKWIRVSILSVFVYFSTPRIFKHRKQIYIVQREGWHLKPSSFSCSFRSIICVRVYTVPS
jgi:hypothetical protein